MNGFKKAASAALAFAAAITGMGVTAFAANVKPETAAVSAAYAVKNIVIDGVKDSTYNLTGAMKVDHVGKTDAPELLNKSFKGKTYTLWDEEYFYIFTEVTDSDVVKNNGGSLNEAKNNDRITYYFDFANTTLAAQSYKTSAVHGLYYGVHCTNDKEYMTTISDNVTNVMHPDEDTAKYKEFMESTFKTVVKYTSTGYNAETRIRVSNLKFNESGSIKTTVNGNGVKFGFDVYLHDWQKGKEDGRVSLCTWSKDADNQSWDHPGYLGTVTLANKPAGAGKNGWFLENGKWRYYSKGAIVKKQLVTKGTNTVFVNGSGYLATNSVVTYKNKKYCVSGSGKVLKSSYGYKKFNIRKASYVVNTKGVVQANKALVAGGRKYLASKSGKLLKGGKIVPFKKKKYYVSKTGVVAKNAWKTYKKAKYRLGASGAAYKNKLKKIKGKNYYFNKSCKMVKNNTVKLGKKYYYFNGKGVGKRVK